MQILFICQPGPEYGQSLMYHGLRQLGHHVVDYPYNHTFHFRVLQPCKQDCKNGPCTIPGPIGCTNHPAHLSMLSLDAIDHKWDLVVSNNGAGHPELHQALARTGVPIIALDQGDAPHDSWNAWRQCIGTDKFFFFRREFFKGQPGFPLPYSYYGIKGGAFAQKKHSVAFLYRPTNQERQKFAVEMIDYPDAIIGEYSHHEYLNILSESKFAVALRGAGWDTLRYWEIPAMGAILCRMPSPIEIPNDFEDGVNCVEFNTIDELKDKISHYLKHPIVYNTVRLKSLEHFKKFHTTEARARYMLEKIGIGNDK